MESTPLPEAPYPGLRSFRDDEAAIFYGREEQVDDLVQRLSNLRLLAVAGESGCGKSSLVRAGLIPALKAGFLSGTAATWRIAELRPGEMPIRTLATQLLSALGSETPSVEEIGIMTARLKRGPLGIVEALQARPIPNGGELLILVDQFEDLIRLRTSETADERDAFVALLLATVASAERVRVVLTLRTDYLGKCALFRGLPEALSRAQYLTPLLAREQLTEAIVSPARAFGGEIDPILANQIVNEIGRNGDQLPVVQHALMRMWTLAKASKANDENGAGATSRGPTLSLDAYERIGGIEKALSNHATDVYQELSVERRRLAQRMFCALWDDGAKEGDSRRPRRVDQVADIIGVKPEQLAPVADKFRAKEHCFLMPGERDGALTSKSVLDVSHESLFRHWKLLQEWTAQASKDADEYREWRARAARRQAGGRGLLSGPDLKIALEWRARVDPNPAWAARFGDSGIVYKNVVKLLEQSQRAETRRRLKRGAFIALAVVTAACGVWAGMAMSHKMSQRAEVGLFADAASNAVMREPTRALQLALQAADGAVTFESGLRSGVYNTLRAALRRSRFRALLIPSSGQFDDAKLLSNGRSAVTVGSGDGLGIWDLATGRREAALFGSSVHPNKIAITVDGHFGATAGSDGPIDLWDLDRRVLLATLEGHADRVNVLAFSPDGRYLASGSDDGNAKIWNTHQANLEHTLSDHIGGVTALAFGSDGEELATAGDDRRIALWKVSTGKKLRTFATGDGSFSEIAFSSSGDILAGAQSSSITFWDPATRVVAGNAEHADVISGIAFSPDGRRLASVGLDGALRVWDAQKHVQILEIFDEPALSGQISTNADVEPSRDAGSAFASSAAGAGSTKRPALRPRAPTTAGGASIAGDTPKTVAFGADGREVITTWSDGTAKVWSVLPDDELTGLPAHQGAINRLVFSPDGKLLATASADRTVALWELLDDHAPTGSENDGPFAKELFRTSVGSGRFTVAFDRTGRSLATAERVPRKDDSDVKRSRIVFWDITTGGVAPSRKDSSIEIDEESIRAIAFYGKEGARRLVAAAGRSVYGWDLESRKRLFRLAADAKLFALAVSPDDHLIAAECRVNDKRRFCLWDATSGKRVLLLSRLGEDKEPRDDSDDTDEDGASVHDGPVMDLAFANKGHWLVSASMDKTAKIWELDQRTLAGTLLGHNDAIMGVAVQPDSKMIATTGDDLVRLWDSDRLVPAPDVPDAAPGGYAIAFSPDGKHLVAGGRDGVLRVYTLDSARLPALAAARIPLPLGTDACERYAQGACVKEPSEIQTTNFNRLRLMARATSKNADAPNETTSANDEMVQRERFDGARLVSQASEAVSGPIDAAFAKARSGSDDPDAKRKMAAALIKEAVAGGIRRAGALLAEAGHTDPSISMNATGLPDRMAMERLFAYARAFAEVGNLRWTEMFLTLVPGKTSDWKAQTAQALFVATVTRKALEEVNDGDKKGAVERLDQLDQLPDDALGVMSWKRLAATAFMDVSDKKDLGSRLANALAESVNDAEIVEEEAELLDHSGDFRSAIKAWKRAIRLDSTNDTARAMLGTALMEHYPQASKEALEMLTTVSPGAPEYGAAIANAGALAFDTMGNREGGYRMMASVAKGRHAGRWANLAEADLVTGRVVEARLLARRVIEARDVDASEPDSELAMRVVLVSALVESGSIEHARQELSALIKLVESKTIQKQNWHYGQSRAAAEGIKDRAERNFVLAVIDYSKTLGKSGSPEMLEALLEKIGPQ